MLMHNSGSSYGGAGTNTTEDDKYLHPLATFRDSASDILFVIGDLSHAQYACSAN